MSGSMSTRTGVAPTASAQLALATKVSGGRGNGVAGTEPGRSDGGVEGGGPTAERHRVARAGRGRERGLELLEPRALRDPVTAQRGDDRGNVVVVDGLVAVRDHQPMARSSSTDRKRSLVSLA